MPRPIRKASLPVELLLMLVAGLIGRLPRAVALALGGSIGRVAGRLPSRKRRRVAANARRCGDLDSDRLFRSATYEAGRTAFELLWLMSRSREDALAGVTIVGADLLDQAHAEGRGVLLVSGHCSTWDLVALAAATPERPVAGTARHWRFERLEQRLVKLRERAGVHTLFRDDAGTGIAAYRWLSRGGIYCCMMDRISSGRRRVVPFLGGGLMLPLGPAEMACRTGAAVVTGYASRRPDDGVEVTFRRIPDDDFHDPISLLERIGVAVDAQIRAFPDQWFWIFRRHPEQVESVEAAKARESGCDAGDAAESQDHEAPTLRS